MNRNLMLRGLVVGGLAVVGGVLTNGCSAVSNAGATLCCTEYQPGTDMSTVDFKVDASLQGQFRAFAQASGDMSVVAGQALADATSACRGIAVDLGNDPNDAGAMGKSGTDLMNFWCAAAVTQINATFTATGTTKANLQIVVSPAQCSASISATANCQASCNVNGSCNVMANPPTCMGGTLEVDCKGSCTATATAPTFDCTGSCSGNCSGSCEAQGGVSVACQGKCDGSCTTTVMGGANATQADGSCMGFCSGKCTASATAPKVMCTGTCSGTCDAMCTASPGMASVQCSGMCSAMATPLSCKGGTLTGGCMVDANCQANCNASVDAKAECTPPTLTITTMGTVTASAQGQFNILVNTIELNVPKLFVIGKVRGPKFTAEMSGVVNGGASVVSTGSPCLIFIGADIATSVTNFTAAVQASTTITTEFGM